MSTPDRVRAAEVRAGDHIAIATDDCQPARAIVRTITALPAGHELALEMPGQPGARPVRFDDGEQVLRLHEAGWAA